MFGGSALIEIKTTTIYDVLDEFRKRPALFVGNMVLKDPFPIFLGFLQGLQFSDKDPGKPSVWEFSRWLTGRVSNISVNMRFEWLHAELGSKAAYEAFFEYLDEYRACNEIEVATARPVEFTPTFHLLDSEGNRKAPPQPDRLYVGQFSPSDVYFLGEIYGTSTEHCFPYHRTAKAAKVEAKEKWGVPMSAWPR
ncbi:MAG: hypothetical protein JWP89_5697 [Schlesneria sp.]|nr:hypothetical protein [Schlesneria sp.]